MRRPILVAATLLTIVVIAASGCHGKDASDTATAATGPSKGGKMGATSNSTLGLNPNYQGPANGGLGSKAGSQ